MKFMFMNFIVTKAKKNFCTFWHVKYLNETGTIVMREKNNWSHRNFFIQ